MLVGTYWVSSLLFIASAAALLSTSSSHHRTSTTNKTVTPTSLTHHTSTSTIKKTTKLTSSTHHKSSSSTKSSTVTPTLTPSTFYLVAADTGQTKFDGSYFDMTVNPFPNVRGDGEEALQFGNKNTHGAANFTLLADGTLQWNSESGPQYAAVSNGHPYTQTLVFEPPEKLNDYGLVTVTCEITAGVLSCEWGPLVVFYFDPSDVVDGKQIGEIVDIGVVGDDTPFTIQVVPT